MGNTQTAWEPQHTELAPANDLLCVDVLGTQFAVRWGRGVTAKQRGTMLAAWSRCAGKGEQLRPPLPVEPTEAQPFTASVTFQPVTHDGGSFALQAASFGELAESLTSRLTLAAILANAGELTMLHACGVADPATGAVVALVAKSGTGKTTAASVLARRYGYVTDETVAIRADGSVIPYPKPLSVKQGSVKQGPGKHKRQVGPDQLGLMPAPTKPYIQSIVLLDRVEASHPVPATLGKVPLADAVLALIPDSSSQGEFREPLQSLCRLIDGVGGVWRLTYSEAQDLPAVLEPLFTPQPTAKPEWAAAVCPVEPDAPSGDNPDAGIQAGNLPFKYIRRAPSRDAVAIGGDLLMVLDDEIVRLGGIGPAIWASTASAVSLDRLAEEVARVHGMPDGYRDAVETAVQQLIANSVLEQGAE